MGDQTEVRPQIVGFACSFCTFKASEMAGSLRMKYPDGVRLVQVPCSSRVDPAFVIKSIFDGADAVFVAGCHPGDCHFIKGNYFTRRKIAALKEMFDALLHEGQAAALLGERSGGPPLRSKSDRPVRRDKGSCPCRRRQKSLKTERWKAPSTGSSVKRAVLSSGSTRGLTGVRHRIFKGAVDNHVLFNPYFDVNGALYLRRLFSKGAKIVLMLRPCEIRSYVELVKLTQVEPAGIIAVSVDCPGTVSSKEKIDGPAFRRAGPHRIFQDIGQNAECLPHVQGAQGGSRGRGHPRWRGRKPVGALVYGKRRIVPGPHRD